MSVFRREVRSGGPIPTQLIPSRWSTSGVPVNVANAEGVVAFGAAVNLLASVGSMLPLKQYRRRDDVPEKVPNPSPLLTDPQGDGYGVQDFLYGVFDCLCKRGNVWGQSVAIDQYGNPTQLVLVDPDHVTAVEGDRWRVGQKTYDSREVRHLRRFPKPGQRVGASPIAQYADTIGLALAVQRFGADWFADGATPSAILTTDAAVNQGTAKVIKERFMAAVRGSREPAVLGAGLKYTAVQVAPEESQFLQTQTFTAAQCARILGPGLAEILGYDTGDKQTYKTREDVALNLLTYTLDPYLTLIEQWLSSMTPGPHYVRFDRAGILRSDIATRFAAYRAALGPAEPFITGNEVRNLEDMPPVSWGDDKPVTGAQPAPGATPANPANPKGPNQ